MKKASLLIIVVIIAVAAAGLVYFLYSPVDDLEQPNDLKSYTDDTLGYALSYPDDWQVSDDAFDFTSVDLATSTLSERLFYKNYSEPAAFPEVELGVAVYEVPTDYSLQDIMMHDEDITLESQPQNIATQQVNGYDALRYEFINPIEGGPQIEMLVRKDDRIYDLEVAAGSDTDYSTWSNTLEEILDSFKPL